MFPDQRDRPSDPRTSFSRNAGLSRPLGETRNFLSRAASMLSPPSANPCSDTMTAAAQYRPGEHWRHHSVGTTVRSSSCHRERLDLFRPQARRSRSVSVSGRSRNVRKRRLWEHTFFCLASKNQRSPPSPMDRGHLMQAGLGGKTLSFFESTDAEMLHEDLLDAFPKLCTGGGYELLRTSERNTRSLEIIPPLSSGYTVAYLKNVAGQAKIYIRPLQKDLDMTPAEEEGTEFCPQEVCQGCGSSIPLSQLREHIASCPSANVEDETEQDSMTTPPSSPCSPAYSPITPQSNVPIDTERNRNSNQKRDSRRHIRLFDDDNDDFILPDPGLGTTSEQSVEQEQADLAITEEAMVSQAIRESSHDSSPEVIDLSTNDFSPQSLNDIIQHLKKKVSGETHEYHVRRSEVFNDLIRETKKRAYSPFKRVKTYFVGEPGKDTGGLTRELWCLFARHLQQSLCEGNENCRVVRHDAAKLQEGVYRRVGMLMGVSIIQGGSGYPFFAPSTFSYLSGTDVCLILVGREEIPDAEVEKTLQKITSAANDDALREIALDACDVLLSCGFTKPIALLRLQDIPRIIECVTLHTTILQIKAELDEMIKGLGDAGVLEMIQTFPHFFRSLFVYEQGCLTADKLTRLCENRVFSDDGSSELTKEQSTYIQFCDLLEELEGGIEAEGEGSTVLLEDCLSFFTGARQIPPTGFNKACTLNFNNVNMYPTASTCALILTLPTQYHDSYLSFKQKMLFAFCNHGGFGLC